MLEKVGIRESSSLPMVRTLQMGANLVFRLYSPVPTKMTPFLDYTRFYVIRFCVLSGESKIRENE